MITLVILVILMKRLVRNTRSGIINLFLIQNRHKWFSPELSKEEIALLSDPDYFTKEDLKDILNTLILNYINLEDLIDDQLGRTGTNNAAVSDTELQGRRDTYKEKEQGEIQCPEEENR